MSNCTGKSLLFPSNLQRHSGLLSNNPASSGQQFLSGFVALLPCSTNVKQSVMLYISVIQSGPGDIAGSGEVVDVSGGGETPFFAWDLAGAGEVVGAAALTPPAEITARIRSAQMSF
uniref:Uncharacterized protein n=1 Tax=Opuntia streptacantha TaxID=393608 RepID=A0A7C9A033_OPUST